MALASGPADMGRSLVDGGIGRESASWASFVEAKKALHWLEFPFNSCRGDANGARTRGERWGPDNIE